jgi:hypothetical protein
MDALETEKRVIDILVACPPSPNAFGSPIHAVDKAMGWASADTRAFVEDLMKRDLVVLKADGFNRFEEGEALRKSNWRWERKGKTEDAK